MDNKRNDKKKYKVPSGQAVVEALVLLPLVCVCFILCLFFFQIHAQHLWMDHQLYQSLICLAKGKAKRNCENQMQKKIKTFLWMGELKNIQFYKKENEWKGVFTWETGFWQIPFEKTLQFKEGAL